MGHLNQEATIVTADETLRAQGFSPENVNIRVDPKGSFTGGMPRDAPGIQPGEQVRREFFVDGRSVQRSDFTAPDSPGVYDLMIGSVDSGQDYRVEPANPEPEPEPTASTSSPSPTSSGSSTSDAGTTGGSATGPGSASEMMDSIPVDLGTGAVVAVAAVAVVMLFGGGN